MATFMAGSADIMVMPVDTSKARLSEFVGMLLEVVEGSTQPFVVADSSGLIAGCNSAFCKLVGYSKGELVSRHVADLTPDEWREPEAAIIAGQVKSKMPAIYRKEYICKSGDRIPVELYDHVIYDTAGHPLYFYAFVTNVTERQNR